MIDLILDPLGYDIFLRSLLAVVMVGVVCAVVGTYVVLKGLAFIGDAVSHAAFPGVVAAYILGGSYFVGAAIAAVSTAIATRYITRRGDLRSDTSIGVLFAGMFALGIFMFSTIRGYVGDLFAFLVGNVLAISPTDLVALVVLATATLAIVAVLWKELLYATFDPLGAAASGLKVEALEYLFLALVAMTIVISLQAVGIILVVAMLVTPPAAAQLLTVRFGRLVGLAVVISVASSVLGLYLSFWLDVASGATIVLTQTIVFLLALFFGPRHGLLARRPPGERVPVPNDRHDRPPAAEGRPAGDEPAAGGGRRALRVSSPGDRPGTVGAHAPRPGHGTGDRVPDARVPQRGWPGPPPGAGRARVRVRRMSACPSPPPRVPRVRDGGGDW